MPIDTGPLARGVDVESPPDDPSQPAAILNRLLPTQDQLRIRLANRQGEHVYCIGSTAAWVEHRADAVVAFAVMRSIGKHLHSRSSFLGHLYRSFNATYGPLLALAGVAIGVVGWFTMPPEAAIGWRWVLTGLLVGVFGMALLSHAAYAAYHDAAVLLPRVLQATGPPAPYEDAIAILRVESSPLFSLNSLAAVYLVDQSLELLVGFGRVVNLQEDGSIQVLVEKGIGPRSTWDTISSNNAEVLNRTRVKPTIPDIVMRMLRDKSEPNPDLTSLDGGSR